jgi:hypothetical protein
VGRSRRARRAKLFRAILVVKVAVLETQPLVTVRAIASYPLDRAPDTLLVVGPTVAAVADSIAHRVATELLPRARYRPFMPHRSTWP